MKLLTLSAACLSLSLLVACSGEPKQGKTLVVYSSGKMQIDKTKPETITLDPSNQHNEETLTYSGEGKVTVTVKSPAGDKTFELPDNGTYVLNLKKDTLIGGAVNFGNTGQPKNISTIELEHIIDSTRQLIEGKNASDANKTYFLTPGSVKKITASETAKIIGPLSAIPATIEVDKDGKAPEYYKFFTNTDKRKALDELILRLQK